MKPDFEFRTRVWNYVDSTGVRMGFVLTNHLVRLCRGYRPQYWRYQKFLPDLGPLDTSKNRYEAGFGLSVFSFAKVGFCWARILRKSRQFNRTSSRNTLPKWNTVHGGSKLIENYPNYHVGWICEVLSAPCWFFTNLKTQSNTISLWKALGPEIRWYHL